MMLSQRSRWDKGRTIGIQRYLPTKHYSDGEAANFCGVEPSPSYQRGSSS